MRARVKLLLNTLSIILILLAALLFSIHRIYTHDLMEKQKQIHRDTARFMLSLVDERIRALRQAADEDDSAGGQPKAPSSLESLYSEIATSVADYFDIEHRSLLLVYYTATGDILYTSSGRERTLFEELGTGTAEKPEGELTLSDRFGYYVQYPDPPLTFFVYAMNRELFMFRDWLLYLSTGLIVLFTLFVLLNLKRVARRWDDFLGHMSASFSDVIQGKRKWPKRVAEEYGEEFGEFPQWYNSMIERVASVVTQLEDRLRSLFKQRDSLKKMIFLYKKYIPDETLQRMNEKDVDEIVSRKQDVTSLDMELVAFLEPINELYPQVITDELNDLHVFLKDEVVRNSGIINYSHGYRINIVYGVPHADEKSFSQACAGARKILMWVEERNNSDRNRSGIKWNVKLGMTHGVALTGIVGFNYMVLGEVIERSARMLEFAKKFNVPLVTDSFDMLKSIRNVKYRKLDIVPAGTSSILTIFEVFLQKHEMIDQAIKLYNHGLEMFYDEKYEVAVLEFKKVAAILNDDKPSKIFLNRCGRAMKGRPRRSLYS